MSRRLLASLFGFVALFAVSIFAGVAHAELKFCNHTNEQVSLVIGYNSPDTNEWTSEGWWTIDPSQCKVPLGGVLKSRYYYYYAESDSGKWDGDYIFCTQDQKFTIEGNKDCKSRGYAPEGFREIDVGEATAKEIDLDPN
jgi:uncharacterized membrane protein